jgi:hypothetical protein
MKKVIGQEKKNEVERMVHTATLGMVYFTVQVVD